MYASEASEAALKVQVRARCFFCVTMPSSDLVRSRRYTREQTYPDIHRVPRLQLAQTESALYGAKLALQRATDAARRAEERAKAAGAQRLKLVLAQQRSAEAAAEAARAEAVELRFRLRLAELRASAAQVGLASPNPPRHLPQHSPLGLRASPAGFCPASPAGSEAVSASPCGSSPGMQSSDGGDCLTPSPPGPSGVRGKKTSSGGAKERNAAYYYMVDADGGRGGSGSRAGQRRAVPVVPFRGLAEAGYVGECGDQQQQQPAAAATSMAGGIRKQQRPPVSPGTRRLLMAEG